MMPGTSPPGPSAISGAGDFLLKVALAITISAILGSFGFIMKLTSDVNDLKRNQEVARVEREYLTHALADLRTDTKEILRQLALAGTR